jgi:hypothetical protein
MNADRGRRHCESIEAYLRQGRKLGSVERKPSDICHGSEHVGDHVGGCRGCKAVKQPAACRRLALQLCAHDRGLAALSHFSEAHVPGERSNAGSGCTADISRR